MNAAMKARLDAAQVVSIGVSDSGWREPAPLLAINDRIAYPVDALPPIMRDAVDEVQAYVQAPVAMVAVSALSALSLAGQGLVDVERDARLIGPASLYLLTVAESGERKSTCDGYFMKAVSQWERDEEERLRPAVAAADRDRQIWASKKAGLLEAVKAAGKGRKPTDDLEAALEGLGLEPARVRVPVLRHTDIGPESLGHALATEWPCAGVTSAEAGAVFGGHAFNKDTILRTLALLNVLWDGGEHFVRRRTSEDFTVRNARLTAALMAQPAALARFMEASGELSRGTGFLARFLMSEPESTQGTRLYRTPPDYWPGLDAFNVRIRELLDQPLPWQDSGVVPTRLTFEPDAKAAWEAAFNGVEVELRAGGECVDVRDVASKALDNAARIAGLFHLIREGTNGAISAIDAARGVKLALWHLSESGRVLNSLAPPQHVRNAEKLEAWLIERKEAGGRMATMEARQFGPARNERFAPAFELLVDKGRARVVTVGKEKRIELNPAVETRL